MEIGIFFCKQNSYSSSVCENPFCYSVYLLIPKQWWWHFDCSIGRLYMLITHYHQHTFFFFFLVRLLGLCYFVLLLLSPVAESRSGVWKRLQLSKESQCVNGPWWHSSNHLSVMPGKCFGIRVYRAIIPKGVDWLHTQEGVRWCWRGSVLQTNVWVGFSPNDYMS